MHHQDQRNSFEKDGWLITKLNNFKSLHEFSCGDHDLNEYFKEDAITHRELLLTETYEIKDTKTFLSFPIGMVSLCNDAVRKEKIKNQKFYKNLPEKKRYPNYPAVKITRLGVHSVFQGCQIGSHMINLLKTMFISENRTGCRLITVDAYNKKNVIKFYEKNQFQFFSDKDKNKKTRAMFFDLKRLTL